MATCLAMHPRDLNIMLIGYEGGVAAWDFQKNAVAKTFEMTLPPGAPGGGSYQDSDVGRSSFAQVQRSSNDIAVF